MTTPSQSDPQRPYRSPRRAAAAQMTRARIRAEARRLFLEDGYAATSVRAIARGAGVAEKTVYLQFATKPALLKDVVETTIVGDDAPIAAHDRRWFRDILDERDPARKLMLLVEATSALHERTGPVFTMARGAAAVDPDAADLWAAGKRGHAADMGLLAESFAADGMLPGGLDTAWATSVLYVLIGPETWHLLRAERGQDPATYRHHLSATLTQVFGPVRS